MVAIAAAVVNPLFMAFERNASMKLSCRRPRAT